MTGRTSSATARSSRSAAISAGGRRGTPYKTPISEGPYLDFRTPSRWYVPVASVKTQGAASQLVRDLIEPWQRTGRPTRGPVTLIACPPSCEQYEWCEDHQVRTQCYIYDIIDPFDKE